MWRAFDSQGFLKYKEFVETVTQLKPFYWLRLVGGLLYIAGVVIMMHNFAKTVGLSKAAKSDLSDPVVKAAPIVEDHSDSNI